MAIDYSKLALAKPEPRKRVKGRKRRAETKQIKTVRPQVAARDGYCRPGKLGVFGDCDGPSEWCHFGEHQRFKTRNQAPEIRHTTGGTFMGCKRHHVLYDAGQLLAEALTSAECDGPLSWKLKGSDREYREN